MYFGKCYIIHTATLTIEGDKEEDKQANTDKNSATRKERGRERERDSVVISDAYVHACIAEECKHPHNKQ